MITTPLKHGEKCYWKFGDDGYGLAYFISLNQMPHPPHAVKIKHQGQHYIVKDCEVVTVKDRFLDEFTPELDLLKTGPAGRFLIKQIAETLGVPYSRVLRVSKKAKELGIQICGNKKDSKAKKKSSQQSTSATATPTKP